MEEKKNGDYLLVSDQRLPRINVPKAGSAVGVAYL